MNYIVLDLEWNQSNNGISERVEELPFEIIEIGAIHLNEEKKIISEFSRLVKPSVYHEMHGITQGLIHLQMKELEKGMPFPKVVGDFFEWCGQDYIFCTWGPLDLVELQRNMAFYHMPPLSDGPIAFLDVQKLYSIAFDNCKSRCTLQHAVNVLQIEEDIPFHRAFSDAYYTARILQRIGDEVLQYCSFDVYHLPSDRKKEIHIQFDTYAKYISRGYSEKQRVLMDREVMSTKCFYCHHNIKKKQRWFTLNGKHYYAVGYCDKHGNMKAKIRLRKNPDGLYYASKTMKFVSEEEANQIITKYKERRV